MSSGSSLDGPATVIEWNEAKGFGMVRLPCGTRASVSRQALIAGGMTEPPVVGQTYDVELIHIVYRVLPAGRIQNSREWQDKRKAVRKTGLMSASP